MRTLKQLFCRHNWRLIAKHKSVNEVLFQCNKCKMYKVWHRGINLEYRTNEFPNTTGWEVEKEEKEK